jgi:hypothetical protein
MEVKGHFIFKDNSIKVSIFLNTLHFVIKNIIKGTLFMSFNNVFKY